MFGLYCSVQNYNINTKIHECSYLIESALILKSNYFLLQQSFIVPDLQDLKSFTNQNKL